MANPKSAGKKRVIPPNVVNSQELENMNRKSNDLSLHPMQNALTFLKKLKTHNNREWFESHKNDYLAARDEFLSLCDGVIGLVRKFDPRIAADTEASACMFRIYRDIRFSKDKTPYKVHMAASINPGGRKSITAGYYLHVEPGASFVAGGVWMPPPPMLQAIRQEIDYEPDRLLALLKSKGFRKYFRGFDEEGRMQAAPKGYAKDHPQIEFLKNRNFIVSHNFSDKQILAKNASRQLADAFAAMHPLMEYLRQAQDHES